MEELECVYVMFSDMRTKQISKGN